MVTRPAMLGAEWQPMIDLLSANRAFARGKPAVAGPPNRHQQARPDRRPQAADLDLILVPGLTFDRSGGRLGLGKGYYDRFLKYVRPDAPKIAPAFECQLLDEVPVSPHDVRVDMVVTENAVYSVT